MTLQEMFVQQAIEFGGEQLAPCPICLRLFEESELTAPGADGLTLTREDAPQQAHPAPSVVRCLTCSECNNARGFEAQAAAKRRERRKDQRRAELAGDTPSSNGVMRSFEMLVELKTAYCIAFAALGYAYILDPALEVVRMSIRHEQPMPHACTYVEAPADFIRSGEMASVEIGGVAPALLVAVAPAHPWTERADVTHVVTLPRPGGPMDVYKQIDESPDRALRLFESGIYAIAPEAQLARHWDQADCGHTHPVSRMQQYFVVKADGNGRRQLVFDPLAVTLPPIAADLAIVNAYLEEE